MAPPALASGTVSAPADVVVGESDDFVDLPVRLSAVSPDPVSVTFATASSSALPGGACNADYVHTAGTLNFAPGETVKLVHVELNDCADVENLESFTLGLTAPVNAAIARATARVSIVDDDTVVATPRLYVRDAVVDEKDGVALVPVLLGGPRGQASNSLVTVDYATHDATAAAGDYTTTTGTLTFAPGQTAKTVTIPIADDAGPEPLERLTMTLTNPTGATIVNSTGTVWIGANDTAPSTQPSIAAPADTIVGEGDGYVDLTVKLSTPGTESVSVNYATAASTALPGSACNADYIQIAGTLNFAPGETTKTVRVELGECADAENLESFTLGLATAVNGVITRATTRVSILDNDTTIATPRLSVRNATVDEKDGLALVSVLLGQASNSVVTVDYATHDGTATAADYTPNTGTLTFAPGQTAKTIPVAIADDAAPESFETLTLSLTGPANATVVNGTGTVTIAGNDTASSTQPAIAAPADTIVSEGDGYVDLPVELSTPGTERVSVDYATAGSTALPGTACNADYVHVAGTLNFAPGETAKTVRVDLGECADAENLESFTLGLAGAVNGAIARAAARVSIVDNDTTAATPRLSVRDAIVDEADGLALVSVLLGQASNSVVTVDYATHDGTATAADYTPNTGTLTFAPGQTAKTIPIVITDDAAPESFETLALSLTGPANATVVNGTGTVTIAASDQPASVQPAIAAPADTIVGEGDGYVDLTVKLSAPGTERVSVNYATAGSTALPGTACNADYVHIAGTVNFAPGETAKTVRVELLECADVENLESFTLGLATAVNGAITRATARVSILDNDTTVPTPKLYVRDATVDEKDGVALVSVLLGGPRSQSSNGVVSVGYATHDGTATNVDYTPDTGTLTFAPGQTVKTIPVVITDDGAAEAAESLELTLTGPVNATLADPTGTVAIAANDSAASPQPAITAQPDALISEGDGYIDLAIRLSAPGTDRVTVNYATAASTALPGTACNADYVHVAGTVNFAPGETVKTVRVEIDDCPDAETLESFTVGLTGAVNGTVTRATARVSILDGTTTLSSIAVTPANPSIPAGTDRQFNATGTFSDASTLDITAFVAWSSATPAVATVAASGLAHGVALGTSAISAALGAVTGSTVLTVTAPQQSPQTIAFASLGGRTFGAPDFTVSATASSGLPVSFTAAGTCTIAGATVHLTGAGTCTVTASQAGDATHLAAADVSRAFAIAKAAQSIAFGALADRTLAGGDFAVSATASSGLSVAFTASGSCSVSGTSVHLTGAGVCSVRATQEGNADYIPAAAVTRSFTISAPVPAPTPTPTPKPSPTPTPTPPPKVRCTVPNVAGKTLAAAKSALTRAHCRTGTVTRAYSRKVKKGRVISQSRKPKKVLAADARVNLVVSRGRRR